MQTYLRLANIDFAVHDCQWGSSSPTGQVPALDTEAGDLIGAEDSENVMAEFEGARAIISHLQRKHTNLDARLSPTDRAELLAFSTLINTRLIPALLYTTWCEPEAYSKRTKVAIGASLPFPLNHWLPHVARKTLHTALPSNPAVMYEDACAALDAIAARLVSHAAPDVFFITPHAPTSLDPLLHACLRYLHSAPVIHPELREKFKRHSVMKGYVDWVGVQANFEVAAPFVSHPTDLQWKPWKTSSTSNTNSGGSSGINNSSSWFSLGGLNKKGKMWLLGAGAVTVGYVLLSGQYFEISYALGGDVGEDDDGEEMDD